MNAPVVRTRKLTWPFVAVIFLSLLILSPVDLIPDWVSGPLGFLDDIGYGILDIILLLYIRHKNKLEEQSGGKPGLDPDKKIS